MKITQHGLKKPERDDFYDVEDFNNNTDVLEQHLVDIQQHVNVKEIVKITEPDTLSQIDDNDTNNTMWGKVKKVISTMISHINLAASSSTLGHVKIGTGLQMTGGMANVKLTDSLALSDDTVALSAKGGKKINDKLAWAEGTFTPNSEYVKTNYSWCYKMGQTCVCQVIVEIKKEIPAMTEIDIGNVSIVSYMGVIHPLIIQSTGKCGYAIIGNTYLDEQKGKTIKISGLSSKINVGETVRACLIYFTTN